MQDGCFLPTGGHGIFSVVCLTTVCCLPRNFRQRSEGIMRSSIPSRSWIGSAPIGRKRVRSDQEGEVVDREWKSEIDGKWSVQLCRRRRGSTGHARLKLGCSWLDGRAGIHLDLSPPTHLPNQLNNHYFLIY